MDFKKEAQIRTFVQNQLNDAPDLSALTLGLLKRQYMSHVGCDSLSPEAKTCIKRVVEEELLNMQISGTEVGESENASVVPSSNKRKRGEDDSSGRSVDEDESSAKKIRRRSTSSGSAEKGKRVKLNGKSFETECDGSEEEERGDRDGVDGDGAGDRMDVSDEPRDRKGPAGDTPAVKRKVGGGERKPRDRKRPTTASSDDEKESSSSLSDGKSEGEDEDPKKTDAQKGVKMDGGPKGGKGGRKPQSGKLRAEASTDEEQESSPQSDEDEGEEDDEDAKEKEAPGNKLDGKQKGATGGKTTGNGKRQAEEAKKESSSSQSREESEEEDKRTRGKAPGAQADVKRKVGARGRKPGSGKQHAKDSRNDDEQPSSPQSDEDGEEDKRPKTEHNPAQDGGNSDDADRDKEGEVPTTKSKEDAQDSDSSSSSLPSLEDVKDVSADGAPAKKLTKQKGDRKQKEDDSNKEKEENKAMLRLKRYIALCGTRRNYKKLFEGCRSVRSKVAVLKKELEDLGVKGHPSIEKCKKARLKREEAQELAELDVSNIITTQGRPKRRGSSAWQEPPTSPATRYKRTLNSDSEEGSPTDGGPNGGLNGGRHWGNLQGIISDDGDSDR